MVTLRPSEAQIWAWLEAVPDPEIPVISVVDLGIVRGFSWQGDKLEVQVTPTYSGCPATQVINQDITQALHDQGIDKVVIKRQLSPPWTTQWISSKGRAQLLRYGIAPPNENFGPGKAAPAACPRCQSAATECVSWFGSTPCKAAYRCQDCLEPFDHFKCH